MSQKREGNLNIKIKKNKLALILFSIAVVFGFLNFNYLNIGFVNLIGIFFLLSLYFIFFYKDLLNEKFFIISALLLTFFLLRKFDYYSLYFSIHYLVLILAYFIGKSLAGINLVRYVTSLFVIFVILNLFFYLFHAPLNLESNHLRLVTVIGGPPNSSFIFALFALNFYFYKRWKLFSLCIVLLLLTGNRITILALLVAVGVAFLLNNKRYLKKIILYSFALFCLLIIAYYLGFVHKLLELARVLDEDGNLKMGTIRGRFVHWNWAIIHFNRGDFLEKMVGYGINSTKDIFFTTHRYNNQYTGSGAMHNEYLRILVENGIFGLILLGSFMVSNFRRKAYLSRHNFIFGVAISVLVFITAITDNVLYSFNNYLLLSFFLLGYLKNHKSYT